MPGPSYDKLISKMSLAELEAELQSEIQALNEILQDSPYPDRGRQISATRENIAAVKQEIGRKTRTG